MKDKKLTAWNLLTSVAVEIEILSNKNQELDVPNIKNSETWINSNKTISTPIIVIIFFGLKSLFLIGLFNEEKNTRSIALVNKNDFKNSIKSNESKKNNANTKKYVIKIK